MMQNRYINRCIILSFSIFSSFLLFITSSGFAQSYEGTLGNEFVWFDLSIQSDDGKISGSYFYKKIFIKIPLSGKKSGDTIHLSEMGKNNKITGYLQLVDMNDCLSGIWKSPSGKVNYTINVYKSDSLYRPPEKLDIGGKISISDPEAPVTEGDKSIVFIRKNIISYSEGWSYDEGAYPIGGSKSYTVYYDSTGKLIDFDILHQIRSDMLVPYKQFIEARVAQCFADTRKKATDSEWRNILNDQIDSTTTLDSVFTWKENYWNDVKCDIYVNYEGLKYYVYDYFHFPHVALALDLDCDITVPIAELSRYLAKGSVLQRLISK